MLGDGQEKRDEVMSHSCVLGGGQEKRDEVMSHICVLVEEGQEGRGQGSWCKCCSFTTALWGLSRTRGRLLGSVL